MPEPSDRPSHRPSLSERLCQDPETRDWLAECTGGGRASAVEPVQSLWSGYGQILRVHLDGGDAPTVILKQVEPPAASTHPRGWGGATSHARKLHSYEVERCFYTAWHPTPTAAHRTAACRFAGRIGTGWRFVLEDLDAAGYRHRAEAWLSPARTALCIRWLAAFHARHLGREPVGLWDAGTYWHLATRQGELAATEDRALRDAAEPLDRALRNARFRTIVHGDAKVANFCFAEDDVAAVDFQYVGGGIGVQDLAYFLSSCMDDTRCELEADRHLDTYFARLREHLPSDVDADALEAEWRDLYPAAWADFHRFLAGWAPDHWKIHAYTRRMTELALARLR